jgi:hypothetical protein
MELDSEGQWGMASLILHISKIARNNFSSPAAVTLTDLPRLTTGDDCGSIVKSSPS